MTNRHITFTAPGIAELRTEETRTPGPGEVLIKTVCSTVSSGTERANLSGNPNVSTAKELPDMTKYFPRRLGYSSAGVVEAVGEGVKSVKPGIVQRSAGVRTASIRSRMKGIFICCPTMFHFPTVRWD